MVTADALELATDTNRLALAMFKPERMVALLASGVNPDDAILAFPLLFGMIVVMPNGGSSLHVFVTDWALHLADTTLTRLKQGDDDSVVSDDLALELVATTEDSVIGEQLHEVSHQLFGVVIAEPHLDAGDDFVLLIDGHVTPPSGRQRKRLASWGQVSR